ncbi:hypothetical protein K501DRAFT_287304 [Backusella circina FSU 941]|nr:hypothetical protein K501DRAFT_287304 [Backusella circina FSU 941]
MVPSQPCIPKDPPSYESLYQSISSASSYIHVEQRHHTSLSARLNFTIQRFIHRHLRFLQCLIAATTVSVTVMLLLWQLQNLSTVPPDSAGPWFDHDEYSLS